MPPPLKLAINWSIVISKSNLGHYWANLLQHQSLYDPYHKHLGDCYN
jgi:hypothetical protein